MGIYRTLKQRGLDPLAATEVALRDYVATGPCYFIRLMGYLFRTGIADS